MNRNLICLVPLLALAPFAAQADPIICGTTQGVTCFWYNHDEPVGMPSEQFGDPVRVTFNATAAAVTVFGNVALEFVFATPITSFSFDYNEILTAYAVPATDPGNSFLQTPGLNHMSGLIAPPSQQNGPEVQFWSGDTDLVFQRGTTFADPDPYNGTEYTFDATSQTPFDQVWISLLNYPRGIDGIEITNIDPPGQVPEPSSLVLLGTGLLGLGWLRGRKT